MDLGYGPEEETYRAEVRAFLEAHWSPSEEPDGASERRFRSLATEQGYLYRSIPRRFGGSEQESDLVKAQIIREEFTRAGAPMELQQRGVRLFVPTLLSWGTEAQKQYFIPRTLNGEFVWSQGYSEPAAGSDLASLQTRAELQGDRWVINGQKVWSSDGHLANHMFVLVRTDPDQPKHDGISYLMVRVDQPGVIVRPIRQITGDSSFSEVFFENAATPADWIVGPRGRGWEVARTTLKHERTNLTGVNFHTGMFQRLLQLAKDTPREHGRAIDDPIIRDRLAALQGWLLATTYSTYRQFSMSAVGQDPGIFGLMMKLNGSNMAHEMYRIGRDIIADDFLLMRAGEDGIGQRRSRAWVRQTMMSLRLSIAGGTSNIQRNIIAERGLGLPRDDRVRGDGAVAGAE